MPLLEGIFELKFSKFQTWIGFSSTIFQQNQNSLKPTNLFILNYNWANFQRNRRKKKIFQNFRNWIGFFSNFFQQNHKTRKFRNLIFHVLNVCQVSGEKFFWPLLEGVFGPKFPKNHQKFPNFHLESDFFPLFFSKIRQL